MSKELSPLEALEKTKKLYKNYEIKIGLNEKDILGFDWCFAIIEKALKEYEQMKDIRITARFDLDQVNKEHKALEIIRKELMLSVKEDNGLYRLITYQSDNHLIKTEQYELLKEVLL